MRKFYDAGPGPNDSDPDQYGEYTVNHLGPYDDDGSGDEQGVNRPGPTDSDPDEQR